MTSGSEIAQFFAHKSVLVTGATGFMGKVLLEKLLRVCVDLKQIFVLIRPFKSLSAQQRLDELLDCPLYDHLRQKDPNFSRKVVVIEGDITKANLGISDSTRQRLIQDVNIVFHSAATVKFDEKLKLSITINVLGTKQLVELSRLMTSLEVFVHVSTAYGNCDRNDLIMEKIYSEYINCNELITLLNLFDDEQITKLIEDHPELLLGNKPNTYTFTKALTECWLEEHAKMLPICIVRPSIVVASYREPLKGWVDNWNGPNGIIAATAKGIFRTMLCDPNKVADLIPVDYVINLMCAAAYYTANLSNNTLLATSHMSSHPVPIFNCCSGKRNAITWNQFIKLCYVNIYRYPSSEILWYPAGSVTHSRSVNFFKSIFVHLIPATIADCILMIFRKKPMMTIIRKKLEKGAHCLEYFATKEWNFDDQNTQLLFQSLSVEDKVLFNFDVKTIDWPMFIKNYILGIRKYLFKETDQSLIAGRKLLQRTWIVHRFVQILLFVIAWKAIFKVTIVDVVKNFIYFVIFLISYVCT